MMHWKQSNLKLYKPVPKDWFERAAQALVLRHYKHAFLLENFASKELRLLCLGISNKH